MKVFTKQEVLHIVGNRLQAVRALEGLDSPVAKQILEQAQRNAVLITDLFVADASPLELTAAVYNCGWAEVAFMSLNKLGDEFNQHSKNEAGMEHTFRRAMEELMELYEEMTDRFDDQEIAGEAADIVLTLAAGLRVYNIDLDAAVARKHARNLSAEWILQPNGSVKRVKT